MRGQGRTTRRGGIAWWALVAAPVALALWPSPVAAEPEPPPGGTAESQVASRCCPSREHHHEAGPPCERTGPIRSCPEEGPENLEWNPDWPRFHVAEYVASGVFLAGALASLAIPADEERWTSVNSFDREMRLRLRLGDAQDRETARDASDVLLTLGINHLLFDTLVVAWWGHQSPDVAWEMAWISIEAISLNAMINGVVAGLTSRQRPYHERCADPYWGRTGDCRQSKHYRSFFSGHTSTSFTMAGLVCSHHANLPLYGGGAPDVIACSTSMLFAGAVGTMRVVADQHYVSDVLTGAAVGLLTGLGLPWLLHYRGGALEVGESSSEPSEAASAGPMVGVVPTPLGGTIWGVF